VSAGLCDQIADMRRKLKRIDKRRLLFLDETALRLSAAPTHTIVLPGEQAYVVATETSCCDDSGAVPDAHVSYLAQRRERRGEWVVGVRMVCCCWSVED
jgi:hypothetical protein